MCIVQHKVFPDYYYQKSESVVISFVFKAILTSDNGDTLHDYIHCITSLQISEVIIDEILRS